MQPQSRKIPKTLSGIETQIHHIGLKIHHAGKYLKPYQGLKPIRSPGVNMKPLAGKYLKPYQGLKHKIVYIFLPTFLSRKIPKTLSGIETSMHGDWWKPHCNAGKYLKPYQGLKRYS